MDLKSKLVSPLIWLVVFFTLLFTYTKIVGPLPFSVNSVTTQKSTTFDVMGMGKVAAKPDIASVTAGIQVQAQSVKSAQDQINNVTDKVTESLKGNGIDPKDIKTVNYSIYPVNDYSNASQKITGYTANTSLLIKVRNLDNINNVIDTATANGANQVSGITFDIDDKTKLQNEARQKAVDEARKKASDAAKIAGFKLGKIINYSENQQGFDRPMPFAVNASEKAAVAPSTQVEPGSSEVTVNVTLSYEIQ